MNKISSLVGAVLLVGAFTACSSTEAARTSYGSSSSPAALSGGATQSQAPAAAGPTITISGMTFGAALAVAPGASITIVNDDGVEHSVTSNPKGAFDTDVDGGKQASFTAPTQPGQYPFICVYHPKMKGMLTVT